MKRSTPLLAAAMLLPLAANAYFVGEGPKKPETVDNQAVGADTRFDYRVVSDRRIQPLRVIGTGQPGVMTGFSDGISFPNAMELMLPPGWIARAAPNVPSDSMMSWRGGQTWTEVLEGWSRQNGFITEVNWDRREVVVERAPSLPGIANPYSPKGFKSIESVEADKVAAAASANPPVTYATLEAFLNEPVQVDLKQATVRQMIEAILPSGWTVDDSAVYQQLQATRADLTSVEARGEALSRLMTALQLTLYPYPSLHKVVIGPAK